MGEHHSLRPLRCAPVDSLDPARQSPAARFSPSKLIGGGEGLTLVSFTALQCTPSKSKEQRFMSW